jgi:hypothetical protein
MGSPPLWLLVTCAVNVTFVETGTARFEEVKTVFVGYPTCTIIVPDADK